MEQNLTPGNFNLPIEEDVNLKRYLSMFISNWYWFAAALFIALTFAYAINRYSQQVFSVSSTLLIKDDQMASMSNSIASVLPGGDIFRGMRNEPRPSNL